MPDAAGSERTGAPSSERRVVLTDQHDRFGPELRINSPATARLIAALLVIALGYALYRWGQTTFDLREPCTNLAVGLRGTCSQPPAILRWLQFMFGIAGIAVGVAVVGYFGWFAASGKTWRRRREVAIVLTALVAAWLATYGAGALSI